MIDRDGDRNLGNEAVVAGVAYLHPQRRHPGFYSNVAVQPEHAVAMAGDPYSTSLTSDNATPQPHGPLLRRRPPQRSNINNPRVQQFIAQPLTAAQSSVGLNAPAATNTTPNAYAARAAPQAPAAPASADRRASSSGWLPQENFATSTAHVDNAYPHPNPNSYSPFGLPLPWSYEKAIPDLPPQLPGSRSDATSTSLISTSPNPDASYQPGRPQDTTFRESHLYYLEYPEYTTNPPFGSNGFGSMDSTQEHEMRTPPPDSPGQQQQQAPAEMNDPQSRKRSHSAMSAGEPHHGQPQAPQPYPLVPLVDPVGPAPPPLSPTAPATDEFSPRTRSIKRPDPPMTAEKKYYCTEAPECGNLIFDRKCEWSKHMDKHDRPYRCQHADCSKLQGFTYSGGLLRHEREVHGKHGGPKSQMMCPYPDCKRSKGKGFTRKENLHEHMRRVHPNKSQPLSHDPQLKTDGSDPFPAQLSGDEIAEGPAPRFEDNVPTGDDAIEPAFKRRAVAPEMGAEEVSASTANVEQLMQEIRSLKASNAEKDEATRRMGEAMRQMEGELAQRPQPQFGALDESRPQEHFGGVDEQRPQEHFGGGNDQGPQEHFDGVDGQMPQEQFSALADPKQQDEARDRALQAQLQSFTAGQEGHAQAQAQAQAQAMQGEQQMQDAK